MQRSGRRFCRSKIFPIDYRSVEDTERQDILIISGGTITINGCDSNAYFGREMLIGVIGQSLRLVDMGGNFNITVKVVGGGVSGQAGAVRHSIARALVKIDEATKPALR